MINGLFFHMKNRKKIFVCLVCGKRSNDLYGNDVIDKGWDASCVCNAVEAYEDECILVNGKVMEIRRKS
jgi:hypothetical protein